MKTAEFRSVCYVILATIFILSSGTGVSAADKVYKWKMATSWPTGLPIYKEMAKAFANNVKELTDGRLVIQVLPGGTVTSALETTNAVQKGIVQMAHTWPGYDMGIDRTTAVLGGWAGGMDATGTFHWLYFGGGHELWQEFRMEKFGVVSFALGILPPEVFAHSHKPIKTLDDFKGFKIRTAGAWADILPKLGAAPITLPSAEVFQALERKVIDATEVSTPGQNLPLGYHEITKYIMFPGAHQPSATFELNINKKAWDSLPKDIQAVIRVAAQNTTFTSWITIGGLDIKAVKAFKENGNEIIYLDADVQKQIKALGKDWANELSKENAWAKKVIESMTAFEKEWSTVENIRKFY